MLSRVVATLSPTTSVFAEASAYRGLFTYHLAPTPVFPTFFPPSSPYYPAAYIRSIGGNPSEAILLFYRLVELGQRVHEVRSDLVRGALGFQGMVRDWDYLFSINHSSNRQDDRLISGYVDYQQLGPRLEAGEVNPFGANTPEVLARLRATQVTGRIFEDRSTLAGMNFKLSGSVTELAAGPFTVALGTEGRRETLEMTNLIANAPITLVGAGTPDSLAPVDRRVIAVFAEGNLPLASSLEANLAVRLDHYSDFGTTTNPKLSLRWQAAKDALLRASYGTGFRAPLLYILYAPTAFDQTTLTEDPIRCPVTKLFPDCSAGFEVRSAGNPALKPEKSRQLNAGLVFEPGRGLSATIDYYRVELRDVLTFIPADAILLSAGSYPSNVIRRPPDQGFPDLPGQIDHITTNFENLGRLRTSGIDIDVRARVPMTERGRVQISLVGTYVIDYHGDVFSRGAPGAGSRAFAFGAVSRWRHYAAVDWSSGAWGATLAQTFQNGYNEPDLLAACPPCTGTRRVGSYSIWDAIARYSPTKNLAFAFGVRNLFDRAPPVSTQTEAFQPGIDPTYADPRGRMFHATMRYSFR